MRRLSVGHCDSCHREMPIKSRYGGAFCGTCYYSLPRVPCTRCAKMILVPDTVSDPMCLSCRRNAAWDGLVCVRCQRVPEQRRRIFLPDGRPCCTACERYFVPLKECAYCHAMSPHVARNFPLGLTEPACSKCVGNAQSFPICAGCHRPRRAAGERNGKPYCAACLPTGEPPLIKCSVCRKRRSAYTVDTCEDCAWERGHQHLIAQLNPIFLTTWAAELFADYHREARLRSKRGNWRRALKRDVVFFLTLERAFPTLTELSGVEIVRRLGGKNVRKFRRVMSFLAHAGLVDLDDPDYRLEFAIDALREFIGRAEPWITDVLLRLLTYLIERSKRVPRRQQPTRLPTKARSFDSIVRTAHRFLTYAHDVHGVRGVATLSQEMLNAHLAQYRGLSVRSFVRFFNSEVKSFRKLRMPRHYSIAVPAHLVMPESRRRELVTIYSETQNPRETRWALIGVFNLVYAQAVHRACAMRLDQVRETQGGFEVCFHRNWLELDSLLVPLMQRWLTQRRELSAFEAAGTNPFLFPGLRSGTHINPSGGNAFHRRHRISGRQGRSTAIAALVRSGLTQARLLSDCFGISTTRAHAYCVTFGVQQMGVARFVRQRYAPQ